MYVLCIKTLKMPDKFAVSIPTNIIMETIVYVILR